MSDELQAAMGRVRASTERAITAELRRLNPGMKSPSRISLPGKQRLTASDPEPPPGTVVRDDCGVVWFNDGYHPCCWVEPGTEAHAEFHDPETWMKVAGNYGPVTVIEWGDGE